MTELRRGVVFGAAAYAIWGLFPLFWPLLAPAAAAEVLAHRMLWSLVLLVAVLGVGGRLGGVRRVLADRRRTARLAVAAVLISVNWGTYIYGVDHHHVLETSLGYFVNPIVTVLLGVLVLGERLRSLQWIAIGIATGAVVVLTVQGGRLPWIALVLALTFGGYGLVKKTVGVGALDGLAVEAGLLAPFALLYLLLLGGGGFAVHGPGHAALLVSSGLVTAVPLLLFAGAASRIPLSTLGVLQYLAPSLQFLIGVVVRHEPLPLLRIGGFALVWVAVALFSVDVVRQRRRQVPFAL